MRERNSEDELDTHNSDSGEDEINEETFLEVDVLPKPKKKGRARPKGRKLGENDAKSGSKRGDRRDHLICHLVGQVNLKHLSSHIYCSPTCTGGYKNQYPQSSGPQCMSFTICITALLMSSQISERSFQLDLFDGDNTHEAVSHNFFAVESNVRYFFAGCCTLIISARLSWNTGS
jgi:hypothetical protein